MQSSFRIIATIISIHAPLAGCDSNSENLRTRRPYFNPRTPCGVRPDRVRVLRRDGHFNPRTPCGVRHHDDRHGRHRDKFQSTHPLRGATDTLALRPGVCSISIHAPLAGCDTARCRCCTCNAHFNPRTPCGVRRLHQSVSPNPGNFNPRTPCGVRRMSYNRSGCTSHISIHAPLAGCDSIIRPCCHMQMGFQSTHPLRGATPWIIRRP